MAGKVLGVTRVGIRVPEPWVLQADECVRACMRVCVRVRVCTLLYTCVVSCVCVVSCKSFCV